MTQIIVTVEDANLLSDLKRAIKMLRGVSDISVKRAEKKCTDSTLRAMKDAKEGRTIKCANFEDYLEKVK